MLKQITNFEKSNQYREKVHNFIPGGAHTYSKGDDQFPLLSPGAISRGKGAYVWDLDDNMFLDCSMGLTSVSLGHAYEPVLYAVRNELSKGVNFQRPSEIELRMAEKFLSLVPVHQMIKFCKNGSTATTAAVKLARAYTNREVVVFPSDHPFYSYDDWFIGKTVCDRGVATNAKSSSMTYSSLDLDTLRDIFEKNPGQIACVISEPEKTYSQPDNYVHSIIDLCHKHGALFIMDEMITGFKTDYPGSIKKMNVAPDLATWGKGIANGFSFCALTGKAEIMELGGIKKVGSEKVFLISTTHGGETHAIAAGLATMEVFESQNVIKHIHAIGNLLISELRKKISLRGLENKISLSDTNWMIAFQFLNNKNETCSGFRTLFLQEMIKRGVLFQGAFIPCFSHSNADIQFFAEAFDESLTVYEKALEVGFDKYLIGDPVKPVFRKIL